MDPSLFYSLFYFDKLLLRLKKTALLHDLAAARLVKNMILTEIFP